MWGNVEIALTGKEFSDFLDPDERPRIAELYQRRLAGEKVPSTYETMLRRHDGGQVYVELNAGVISYQGQPADLVIVRDTSERRQSAAALQYSEENFRTLAERANDAIFISDAQGRHVFANERATALTGYSVTELLTTRFRDLVRPEDISWLEARAAARLQGEQPPSQYEIIVRRKDGQEIPLELSVTRTYWRGAPATLVVARDIIERKRAEAELLALRDRLEEQVRARTAELTLVNRQLQEKVEEHRQVEERLRESEARFHGVFEKATTGMCLTGTDGRFLDVNQSLCQMLEYTHVELSATGFAAVTHPDDLPASRECVRSLLAGERETYRFEKRYLKKSRGVVWTDVSTILLRTPEGAPLYFITHIHDITERRQTEDRVRQLNRELEATVARLKTVNQELESFSYSVSHDLRAPLRSLDGFSQALLDDCRDRLDAQGQDYFNRVRAASQRMAQLIDDLLKLSRVTRSELHIESVNLTELARSVLLEIRQVEPDRTVAVTIAPGLQANGDARLLRILLINLLGNAWKFTSRRPGATIEFGILDNAPTPSPLTPVFYIRDNGAGFDMAYVGKLFAPFQRLHGAAEFPGSGIGLATAQRIVLRHGGRIWAKGTPGKGASFFFTLGEQPTPEASSNLHDRNPKRADSDLGFRT
jgi:PAS domain S-box-containing protein